jgi:glycosyltransferase involved in cell wall biosynthesis
MIKNEHFICISSADWDNPYWVNQQHIMSRLSRENKVLYIESIGLRQPVLQKKDLRRLWRRLQRFFQGPIKRSENLYTYSPLLLPFYKYAAVRHLNHWILRTSLKRLIRKLKLDSPVLWSYVPNAVYLKGHLGEKLVVYHCVDEIAANPLIPGESVLAMEKIFLQVADLTFVSSRELYRIKKSWAKEIYYLPNVADVEHILKLADPGVGIPDDMLRIARPVLGFVGAISAYKLDFNLLENVARARSGWSIVLIGAVGEGEKAADFRGISALPNIHILGGRDYSLLPNYLKSFDVCLLPSRLNEYTRHMFPLKFFEYLASGKPVVSTALPSLSEFAAYFYQANQADDFVAQVELALNEDKTCGAKRMEVAKKYSWNIRMEEISSLLEGKLTLDARK